MKKKELLDGRGFIDEKHLENWLETCTDKTLVAEVRTLFYSIEEVEDEEVIETEEVKEELVTEETEEVETEEVETEEVKETKKDKKNKK